MPKLPDLNAWTIFGAVAEHRSFTRAASALGLGKATVSKAVTRLESHLGTALFHRTSRTLTLTETGRRALPHADRLRAEAACAEEEARQEASMPAGLVRLAAPMTFGVGHVAPAIADFMAANPAIRVDLALSDLRVDLVAEGYDAALRIGALPDSSLLSRRLASVAIRLVAAPAYLARHGIPARPADLSGHDAICYANVDRPGRWRLIGPDGSESVVEPRCRMVATSGDAMLPALRAGLGLAILPDFIVDADISAGSLVPILADHSAPPVALHLLTPPGRLRPARVEALLAFLTARFAGE